MKFTATPSPSRWAEILKNDEAIQTSLGVLEKQPEEQVGEVLIQRWDQETMANHGASKTPYRGMYVSVDQLEKIDPATLVGVPGVDEVGMG